MTPQVPVPSIMASLMCCILASALLACSPQSDDVQPVDTQVCFPQDSGIVVSNTDDIPNMKIVETKRFTMVSGRGHSNVCGIALAFMEQVRQQGGNAVIGFTSMSISDVTPLTVIAFYGTATVVEPVEDD